MPSKYDAVADELYGSKETQLNASLSAAKGTNPDDYAKSVQLGRETGVPSNVVQINRPAFEEQARKERAQKALKYDSIAAQWLSNPDNAKIAHDDVENLSAVDSVIQGMKMAGRYTAKAGKSIMAGFPQASAGLWGIAAAPFELVGADSIGSYFRSQQKGAERLAENVADLDPDAGAIERSVMSGFRSAGQNLATLPLGFAARGEQLMLGAMGLMTGGESYGRAREQGLTPAQALAYGIEDATAEVITEKFLGAAGLLRNIKAGSSAAKLFAYELAKEVPGEILATEWQGFNEWMNLNPDKSIAEFIDEQPAAIAQTIIATLVGGSTQIGAFKTLEAIGEMADRTKKAQPEINKQTKLIEQLNTLAQASKVAQRDLQTFKDFVAEVGEDGSFFIDADTFKQSGIADQVMNEVPGIQAQYADAIATSGVIRIPMADYAAIAAKPELAGPLLEHLKTDPLGFSAAEAKQFEKEQGRRIESEMQRVFEQAQGDDAFNASRDAVKQSVLDNLNAVNRNTPAVNETYATLVAARAATRAKQLGITPEEMFDRQPVKIQAEALSGETLNQSVVDKILWSANYEIEQARKDAYNEAFDLISEHNNYIEAVRASNPEWFDEDGDPSQEAFDAVDDMVRADAEAEVSGYRSIESLDQFADLPDAIKARVGRDMDSILYARLTPDITKIAESIGLEFHGESRQYANYQSPDGEVTLTVRLFKNHRQKDGGGFNAGTGEQMGDADVDIYIDNDGVVNVENRGLSDESKKLTNAIAAQFDGKNAIDLAIESEKTLKQSAYHGSPHRFDRFDLSKIGTGEGAQAYGWGQYFAEAKDVAKSYLNVGQNGNNTKWGLTEKEVKTSLRKEFGAGKYRIRDGEIHTKGESGEWKFEGYAPNAQLYAVDIPDDAIARMLDWDKPLSEQPDSVRSAINAIFESGAISSDVVSMLRDNNPIGAAIYKFIASEVKQDGAGNEAYAGAKDASLFLSKYGIPGLRYLDQGSRTSGEGTRNTVIWDQSLLDQISENMQTFYQGQKDRGNYSPSQNAITLLKGADLSTFLHETGHYFFENDISLANELLAKPERTAGEQQIIDDVSALLKWHGFEGDANEQVDQWNQLSFEERRQHHERTAESFEAYLFSGQAPSIELSTYFQKFREYLLQVYKSLKQFLAGHKEAGKLDDTVRSVFDRMLATDEQIALAQQARSMLPLFKTAEEASKFGVDYEAYQALAKGATAEAIEYLQARGLRDLKWIENAKSRELAKLKKQSDALRREVRSQVRTEVMSRPIYQAWAFLTLRMTEDDRLPINKQQKKLSPLDSVKADIQALDKKAQEDKLFESEDPTDEQRAKEAEYSKKATELRKLLREISAGEYVDEPYSSERQPSIVNPGALGAGRLDAALIQNMDLPPEVVKRLEDFRMTAKNGGLHPDVIASMFGVANGVDLATALYEADPPQIAIEKATDARMLAEHGDLATPEAIEEAANKAIYNHARAKMLAAEAAALEQATTVSKDIGVNKKGRRRTENLLPKVAKEAAQGMIARVLVRNLRPSQYEAAEMKAGKAVEKAKNAGKLPEAAAQARARLLNHYAAMAAHDAVEEVDSGVKYLRTAGEPGKVPAEHHDQIIRILEKFDLRKSTSGGDIDNRAMFQTWAQSMLKSGEMPPNFELLLTPKQRAQFDRAINTLDRDGEPVYPDEESQAVLLASMLDQAPVRSYKELTVEEFRGLVESVKQIEHIGKRTKKVLTDRKNREFAAVVRAAEERILGVANRLGRKSKDIRTYTNKLPKFVMSWRGFWSSHIKAANYVHIMEDGEGPLFEHLVGTANAAGAAEVVDNAEAYQKVQALLKPLKAGGPITGKPVNFPTIGRSLNRQERLVIAMNLGNESNEQRLLGGENWTREQIQPVLDTLTEDEWQFVQSMWDLYESYRPRVAEMERMIHGSEPQWIEARPMTVKTADGKELKLRGGYAPVIYDPRASGKAASFAAEKDAKAMMQAARVSNTVNKSFTKPRVAEVKGRPLYLSIDAMIGGIQDTIHYLHWQPWVIDANRLVKALDAPIRAHYGAEVVNQLRAWVGDNAAGTRPARDGAERVVTNLARNVSFAGLAFNVFSAVQQVTGYSQSVAVVGGKWMARGVAKTLENPRRAFVEAAEKSDFMRKRGLTRMRDLAETHKIVSDQGKVRTVLDDAGYAMMLAMQSAVDTPTWWAAYEKAQDAGKDEIDSIASADKAVIDSQGSGMTQDLAMVERATGAMRLLTGFMAFMNTTLNLNYRVLKSGDSVGKKAADLVLINVIPVVLTMALKSVLMQGDDDEKEPEELAKEYVAEQVSFFMGQMIGFREVSQIGYAAMGLESYGYQGAVGMRMFADSLNLAKQVSQGEIDEPLAKAVVSTASDFLRLPGAQINRGISGISAISDDENDTAVEDAASIVFGYRR